MQPEIGAAAFVGDGKAVAADPHFASIDDGVADAARSNNDDPAIARAVRANAGDRRIMCVNDGAEGMRPLFELFEQTLPADPGEPDSGMHRVQRVWAEPGFLERDPAGFLHFGKRAVDAQAQRGRPGNTGAEQGPLGVLAPCAATRAATVEADEE